MTEAPMRRPLTAILLAIVLMCLWPVGALASGLGGYTTEKLIAMQGVSNSAIVIDFTGTGLTDLDIISGPPSSLRSVGPSTNASAGWMMIPTVPASPDNLYSEGGTSFPGGAELAAAAAKNRYAPSVFLIFIAFATAIGLGVLVFGASHNTRAGVKGSLMLMCLAIEGGLIFWYKVGTGVIPGWVLIPFGLTAIVLLMWRNPNNPAN